MVQGDRLCLPPEIGKFLAAQPLRGLPQLAFTPGVRGLHSPLRQTLATLPALRPARSGGREMLRRLPDQPTATGRMPERHSLCLALD